MILFATGVALIGAAGAMLWYFRPRAGKTHRFAKAPFMETLIPITITCGAAFGVAMIVASVMQ